MKAAFCTLGCKVNQYDTEAMRALFVAAGYETVDFSEPADVYVINTCTVTQTGDKKSRQMIARAHALAPEAKIVVAGCYAQRSPEEVLALPGVDLVLGTQDRARVVELLEGLPAGTGASAVRALDEAVNFEPLTVAQEGRTRAHLKIQEGCDRYCTYCIIPYVRGPLRSRPLGDVRKQLEILNDAGYSEVVLTGIHLMSYGKDLNGPTLLDAIAQANGLDTIRRIRLGSLEPQLLRANFVQALAEDPKVCRQFHLSLQSGSESVLRRMNRRYTPAMYAQCVDMLRAAMPGCAITTDVIVGFPGESEAEFQETVDFVKEIGFARIHVFPYSRRQGTPAYAMPAQVEKDEKSKRANRLIALGKTLEADYMRPLIGTKREVLFEDEQAGLWQGYTDTYVRVLVPGEGADLAGRLRSVYITGMTDEALCGKIE